ncbi:MAG: L-fuconate dehydratase [Lentisphaerae bacterium]|jgi:L-fuconate dehydratase|nr:L-fuconate dehydratase [Lentisphaerota bacterium]MBT5607985.1 L-fuconate dehydratase [Lentisphaerota bacterium]MBT7057512.1 L-fuconate dehydratase [Lentisphaerota bacterium]MBT7845658.1 L-fuconate dehydratase [Lentisphaerota bacterium]
MRITRVEVLDVRFPTSVGRHGSDAMNVDPDYSAAYVVLHTDRADGPKGHGLTFTLGRGNEICVAAVESIAPLLVGESLEGICADMAAFWRRLVGDSQLRWIGPEKGAVHMAVGAVVNAVWDLWARTERKPLWKLLADLSPHELVACVDFRHITDALTPDEALDLLERRRPGRAAREAEMLADGYPAYTTSAGWLGYSDTEMRERCQQAMVEGLTHVKMKVGRDLSDDVRRAGILRDVLGPDRKLMMDANQVWDVGEAIHNMKELAAFDPWWIEEPTSPDDVLGHRAIREAIAPIGIATGEQCHNRIMFKQFFQADAIDFCQIDACRLGGVNEVLSVLLMAAKYDVPVCPHAGGVGLCEYVQHLSIFDYLCVSASLENRVIEYVDHLHEHFLDPVRMRNGRYAVPQQPGFSVAMQPESVASHRFPEGKVWSAWGEDAPR